MPSSLWIPFFWIAINSSRSLAYWFASGTNAADADESSGSFYDRNAYLLLMGMGIVILSRRRIDWGRIMHNCRWVLLLYGFYLLSVTWTVDPFVSFKRWIKCSGDIIMILILLTEVDPVEAIRAVFIRCYYVLIPISVLFIKYYPVLGRYTHRWTYKTFYSGVTTNKNSLGQLAMLGGLFLLWHMVDAYRQRGKPRTVRSMWPDLLVLGMGLWLLNKAGSSTSTMCFIVGTVILFLGRRAWVKSNLKNLGWCVSVVGIFMLLFTVSEGFRGAIAGILGRDATLTDRTLIWDMALKSGSNPIIGSGFENYWASGKGDQIIDVFHVTYAHNAYLDQYLNVGFIGLIFFVGMLFAAGRNATSHFASGSTLGYLFMALFWTSLLFNYTEIAFGRSNVFGMTVTLMAVIGPFFEPVVEVKQAQEVDQNDEEESPVFAGSKNVPEASKLWP